MESPVPAQPLTLHCSWHPEQGCHGRQCANIFVKFLSSSLAWNLLLIQVLFFRGADEPYRETCYLQRVLLRFSLILAVSLFFRSNCTCELSRPGHAKKRYAAVRKYWKLYVFSQLPSLTPHPPKYSLFLLINKCSMKMLKILAQVLPKTSVTLIWLYFNFWNVRSACTMDGILLTSTLL